MRTKGLLAVMILLNLFCISFIFKIFPYLGVLFFKLLTLCIGEGEVVKFSIFLCFTAISRGHGNGDYIKTMIVSIYVEGVLIGIQNIYIYLMNLILCLDNQTLIIQTHVEQY